MSTDVAPSAPARAAGWAHATVDFLRAVRSELSKVTWPSRDELVKATRMIVVLSIVLGLLIGWMDKLLNLVLVDGVAALTR
ncbi:MAG TPA: preprotein translocase subunit SecE [Gemmatimonadales bacterium]|nr:preprotein translocase subunit SecE [Gemmatimonadales bacterium]